MRRAREMQGHRSTYRNSRLVHCAIPLVAVAVALAAPATASANRYVDDTGADTGTCTNSGTPCQTINYAVGQAVADETIFVAPGTYAESVTLGAGKSLQRNGTSAPVIDGAADPAVQVLPSDPAGVINGFTLRSTATAAKLQAPAILTGNTFDSDATTAPGLQILPGADGSEVSGNTFTDPGGADYQIALQIQSVSSTTSVSNNSFSGFGAAILIAGARPQITGNTITGTHQLNGFPGIGILVHNDALPTMFSNVITLPGAEPAIGIWIAEDVATVQDTGADIEQTRIFSHSPGIRVDDAAGGVYLFSVLIAKSPETGLVINDNSPTAGGEGDVNARNVTVWGGDSAPDITLQDANLQLDSSIVGPGGINRRTNGAHCTIGFSRGPFSGSSECNSFQTTAGPDFANPAASNYHLKAGSPMIEKGNPASPAVGTKDIDGDARAIDGDRDCAVRRDIGADEFKPSQPGCEPPFQTRVIRHGDRDFLLRIFGRTGGNYTLCVRSPERIGNRLLCRGGTMRRGRSKDFGDTIRWGTNFKFQGPGHYRVSWYKPGTSKILAPRKAFDAGVCPPSSQLMDGVWKPSPRLRVISPCTTITGRVTSHKGVSGHDNDLIFGFNSSKGRDPAHVELIPRDSGQIRGGGKTPRTGERIRMTGVFVCDGFHGPLGHTEMHPVFSIVYLDRGGAERVSGPQFGGTPSVGLAFPGWHPCP